MEGLHARFPPLEHLLIGGGEPGRSNLDDLYAPKRELTRLRDAAEPIRISRRT